MIKTENTATDLRILYKELEQTVQSLTAFYSNSFDWQQMVYTEWTAKDILGHIVFWHESFARNLNDLGNGVDPDPLKGKLSEVNQRSVDETRDSSIENLISWLMSAQNTIGSHIFNISIEEIPYKKGSRSYSRIEHVEVVDRHIKRHLKDLRKHYRLIEKPK